MLEDSTDEKLIARLTAQLATIGPTLRARQVAEDVIAEVEAEVRERLSILGRDIRRMTYGGREH